MNKKFLITGIASVFFVFISNASASEKLTKDEATALLKDKTFDVVLEKKNKKITVYSSADGVHTIKFKSGKMKKGTWRINNKGKHCVTMKKENCTKVISIGNGVYHKIGNNGKHSHTLSNFRDGNQL